ncbi:TPA: hypothetical protein DCE37_15130 [Candidatus Latescibacteria bacterium]|nr:hypothetical protein [Candidatus Latescibacterota bacterium]
MADLTVQVLDDGRPLAFCRCGASENKPYCDGAHRNFGFSSSVKA